MLPTTLTLQYASLGLYLSLTTILLYDTNFLMSSKKGCKAFENVYSCLGLIPRSSAAELPTQTGIQKCRSEGRIRRIQRNRIDFLYQNSAEFFVPRSSAPFG